MKIWNKNSFNKVWELAIQQYPFPFMTKQRMFKEFRIDANYILNCIRKEIKENKISLSGGGHIYKFDWEKKIWIAEDGFMTNCSLLDLIVKYLGVSASSFFLDSIFNGNEDLFINWYRCSIHISAIESEKV